MMKLLVLLSTLALATASCPNDCNGHGACNQYSSCDCYRNWMGADCSERVCYFGLAFVDTPAGDLNTDGLISDARESTPHVQGFKHRTVNQEVHEIYPWYAGWGGIHYKGTAAAATTDASMNVVTSGSTRGEAHFYKECSNKGICDRTSGTCQCFPGFTGEGCSRTACANDCSGHGVCRRLVDSSPGYRGWDAYATQECACDPGYFGADCSLRKCPKGDDPVTKYQGFTRITLKDKAAYSDYYDTDMCPSATDPLENVTNPDNTGTTATLETDTVDWVKRIWSHDLETTSSAAMCNSTDDLVCYGWNPWYTQMGHSVGVNQGASPDFITGADNATNAAFDIGDAASTTINDLCAHSNEVSGAAENTALCMQQPIAWRDNTARTTAVINTHKLVVTGSASQASGRMTTGGCQGNSCLTHDFWSLYVRDVTGQFQVGDMLKVEGYEATASKRAFGFELCNYISTIGTYYAESTTTVQSDEAQILQIAFQGLGSEVAFGTTTVLEGYFALEFTDEMGDKWMTEAISVKATNHQTAQAVGVADFSAEADTTDAIAAAESLAVRIQDALEALPNGIVPNVQVEYLPVNAVAGNGSEASTQAGGEKRLYMISFLENTGNLAPLDVAYSFTEAVFESGTSTFAARADAELPTGVVLSASKAKRIQTNATCQGGNDGANSSFLECVPYYGQASAAQTGGDGGSFATETGLTALLTQNSVSATASIYNMDIAQLATNVASYGNEGSKENVECSNRGMCDYSSGLCQCFAGFTEEDCSRQNSLAPAQ